MAAVIPSQITTVQITPEPVKAPTSYEVKRADFLARISFVESSGGKNTKHQTMTYGMHKGVSAVGQFGLMPITVIETVKKNPALAKLHPKLITMEPKLVAAYMKDFPKLEGKIASRHYDRIYKIFKGDEERMALSWFIGIQGVKNLVADGNLPSDHFYVKRVMLAGQ